MKFTQNRNGRQLDFQACKTFKMLKLVYDINCGELNLQIWKVNLKSITENSCPFQIKIFFSFDFLFEM